MYYSLGMKRCPQCGETKPRAEFHKGALRADGLQPYCKSCRAKIDHERYERSQGRAIPRRSLGPDRGRAAWLLSLKAGRPCTDCGRVYPPQVMQWDHVPGFDKLGDVSAVCWGRPREEVLAEIAKCELVCANCHNIRTFARNGWASSWSLSETSAVYLYWLERSAA